MMPGMRPRLATGPGSSKTKAQPLSYALSHGIPRRVNRLPSDAR